MSSYGMLCSEVDSLRAERARLRAELDAARAEVEQLKKRAVDADREVGYKMADLQLERAAHERTKGEKSTWHGIAKDLEEKSKQWLDERDQARAALSEALEFIEDDQCVNGCREHKHHDQDALLARARTVLGKEG